MESLESPLTLPCGLTVPGRVALAPLTNTQSAADGTLLDAELHWLSRRAEGGFPWISTCAAFVSEEGHAWNGQLGISRDDQVPRLTELATRLRAHGSVATVQLHHGGAKATLAPTKLSTVDGENQRAATDADLERVIADYVAAAVRAEAAGFDGVEVHGANGYLFTQFLAPADNPRTDRWGGSLEGRARLLRRAVQGIRAEVSAGFAVGLRLSPVDLYAPRGLVLADSVQVARWMVDDGADFVHLSLGDAGGEAPHEPGTGPVARAFRDAMPAEVAVLAAGGMWTRADTDRARAAGVDVPVLGRAGMAHPDWMRVSGTAGWEPVRPPWEPDFLREAGLGEAFLAYINAFPGMVVGGAPPRG